MHTLWPIIAILAPIVAILAILCEVEPEGKDEE
jgi:hypothetical protein